MNTLDDLAKDALGSAGSVEERMVNLQRSKQALADSDPGLATALRSAGARAEVVAVPGESHGSLNKGLGEAGDFATQRIDRFLGGLR